MVAQGGSVAQVGSGELSVPRGAQRELRVAQVRSREYKFLWLNVKVVNVCLTY